MQKSYHRHESGMTCDALSGLMTDVYQAERNDAARRSLDPNRTPEQRCEDLYTMELCDSMIVRILDRSKR